MVNPVLYALDDESEDDRLVVRHKIPYSDLENLNPDEQQGRFSEGRALEFGHTLDDLIGGPVGSRVCPHRLLRRPLSGQTG